MVNLADQKENINKAIFELFDLGWSGESRDKFETVHNIKQQHYNEFQEDVKYIKETLETEEKPKAILLKKRCEVFVECVARGGVRSEGTSDDDSIKSIMPTVCGIEICQVLINPALDYLNTENYYIDIIKERWEIKASKEEKTFFELISKVFEPKLINKTVNYNIEINKKGTYILKVSLDKNLWRIVKISHKTTFHKFHLIIQQAFDFDNDHMYAFYTGTSYRNGKEFYRANPLGESEEYDDDLTIEGAEVYKGQQFIYLFDFGDMWEFKIQVMDFIENGEADLLAKIIESKGKSPQQYADWD